MKSAKTIFSCLAGMLLTCASMNAQNFKYGKWNVDVNSSNGNVTIAHNGRTLINKSDASWGVNDDRHCLSECSGIKASASNFENIYGSGKVITISGNLGKTRVAQKVYVYPAEDFAMSEISVSNKSGVEANYMAPISSTNSYELHKRAGNYNLFIPFDNDAWVRYRVTPFGEKAPISYEANALLNADTREALILGSVEHDKWKTGIAVATSGIGMVDTLCVYGGATGKLTRDVIPHGKVKGATVKSPMIFIGDYSDWRDGMEAFADACATFAPKIASLGKRPFGWNSWGKLQTKINFKNACEVSDFIHDNLQDASFENDGVVYIDLDSFWNHGFTEDQHSKFVEHCRKNGQKAGIYFCPFTDWGKNPEAVVAECPEYKYKDIYIYGNGKPVEFDGAYAIDPTHPATRARIEKQMKEFIEWGYEYVKIDFMAHGTYESEKYYDSKITTGIMAYNDGMKFLNKCADGKLWINLSIASLFPANYAHSRRIGCDAWADINNTEYTLNSLTYGWWLDHVYHYNDADHIVYENATDGENRARVTSSAITGVYFLGDDMSATGLESTKNRIVRNTTNPGINEIARTCPSFRPVEIGVGERAADAFYHNTGKVLYVAIFNLTDKAATRTLQLRRVGLSESKEFEALELWSQDNMKLKGNIAIDIPAKDVKVLRIEL